MLIPDYREYTDIGLLYRNMLLLTDHYTDELFSVKKENCTPIIFNINRFYCDVERFFNDADEIMSKYGHGVAYTKTCDGMILRPSPQMDKVKRLYDNYHASVLSTINQSVEKFGNCLLLDAHSFPSVPLPMDLNQDANRPDFCIGFNQDGSKPSDESLTLIKDYLTTNGFSVSFNNPYAGSIFYPELKDSNVKNVMIEVNRKLYMDEKTYFKNSNFNTIKTHISNLIKLLSL